MVLTAEIDKAQLQRAREKLYNHPWNDPQAAVFKASKKAMPKIARQVKAGAPRRTGKLKRSIKGVARKKQRSIIVGIQFKFYGIFVNKKSKFMSKQLRVPDVLRQIAEEIEGND